MKKLTFLSVALLLLAASNNTWCQDLKLNDLEYFEQQGVNVLVYSNLFTGGFNDEKNAGIELIHHGVRTAQGGAIRLSNTPEQWDLVPDITNRKVDRAAKSIETTLRYKDYDFESRVVVTAKGKGVEISVYLDKPLPKALEGSAGFNLEFLPSQYWAKTFVMDGHHGIGLQNVQRRLDLLYPEHHELTINRDSDAYRVNLKLNLYQQERNIHKLKVALS